jgi:hypothetical protein
LSAFSATNSSPVDTLDFLTLALNNFHDSGTYSQMASPLGVLATHLEQAGNYEAAATLMGFAGTTFARTSFPQLINTTAHLRAALGDEAYESLAHAGENMTTAGITQYALDEIQRARAALSEEGDSR